MSEKRTEFWNLIQTVFNEQLHKSRQTEDSLVEARADVDGIGSHAKQERARISQLIVVQWTMQGVLRDVLHELTEIYDSLEHDDVALASRIATTGSDFCGACGESFKPKDNKAEIVFKAEPSPRRSHIIHDTCYDEEIMVLA
jgi:hypothetical protein